MDIQKDKQLKNIQFAKIITAVTSIMSCIGFIIAYFILENSWLLLLAGLAIFALLVFFKAADKIKYLYLESKREQDTDNY